MESGIRRCTYVVKLLIFLHLATDGKTSNARNSLSTNSHSRYRVTERLSFFIHVLIQVLYTHTHTIYLLLVPLKIIPPTTPAAMASPLTIATPTRPSFATLSSISPLRLLAWRFDGSWSSNRSLYRRPSA